MLQWSELPKISHIDLTSLDQLPRTVKSMASMLVLRVYFSDVFIVKQFKSNLMDKRLISKQNNETT